MTARSRRFCVTNFNMDFDYTEVKEQCSYIIVGDEVAPTTNKRHHQIYIEFSNAKSLSSISKKFGKAHVEIARGNAESNIAYCSKEKVLFTLGTPTGIQGTRSDLIAVKEKIDAGVDMVDIADQSFVNWCQYRKAFQEYKQLKEPKRNWVTEVILLTGRSGAGKTRRAMDDGATPLDFIGNNGNYFINNYDGQDTVLFDDVEPDDFTKNRKIWLRMLDRHEMTVNVKGGNRNWKPRKIYLTSNYTIDDLFFGDIAYLRRITEHVHYE